MNDQGVLARITRPGFLGSIIALLVITLSGCRTPIQPLTPVALPSETFATTPPVAQAPVLPPTKTLSTKTAPSTGKIFFDDFTYTDQQAMTANGWIIREKAGWPGVPGATWSRENVSFVDDPDQAGNRLVRMLSSTDGTAGGTSQTQICHQRKYLEGTYATRVRFSDEPLTGPDGDQIVQTFYMISPLEAPLDPDFSEMDNEYLPNGGWGNDQHIFFMTTWETAQIEPWVADNTSDSIQGSLAGWHTLVMQVMDGDVNYLVDGRLIASHWGKYYPEVPMSINYNLWFINGGLLETPQTRQYSEFVDWVYFEADVFLTPPEIQARLNALRGASLPFQDAIPPREPPLPSPCDL